MRKTLCFIVILALLLGSLPACLADSPFPSMIQSPKKTAETSDDALVTAALQALRAAWQKEYASSGHYCAGEHLIDIRGTRLIRIKKSLAESEAKYFGDISCIVEFLMYDDYYGMQGAAHLVGYYDQSFTLNTVTVHRNGMLEAVKQSPLRLYTSRTYNYDFSAFVEEVVDFGDKYNQVMTFTVR